MSLFKSLTGLAKATVQLAKEDKEFRKEAAIAVTTFPIYVAKNTIDAIDLTVGATKNVETALDKVSKRYIAEEIFNGEFTDYKVAE